MPTAYVLGIACRSSPMSEILEASLDAGVALNPTQLLMAPGSNCTPASIIRQSLVLWWWKGLCLNCGGWAVEDAWTVTQIK